MTTSEVKLECLKMAKEMAGEGDTLTIILENAEKMWAFLRSGF